MPESGFEMLEHTADIRIRAFAPSLPGLFAESANGMTAFIFGAAVLSQRGQERENLRVTAADLPALLLDWLSEILYRSSVSRRAYVAFEFVSLTERQLEASAAWRAAEAEDEIKAVTYHELQIRRDERTGIWESLVTYDI